jgi:abortive infection bacteriophage resistance protein
MSVQSMWPTDQRTVIVLKKVFWHPHNTVLCKEFTRGERIFSHHVILTYFIQNFNEVQILQLKLFEDLTIHITIA